MWTNYGMDNIERDCGLQENPYEPEEANERHVESWCFQCNRPILRGESVAVIHNNTMLHASCMIDRFGEMTLEEQAEALNLVLVRGDDD